MGCNCNNNLSESPDGVMAFLEEYKVPICVGGLAIGVALLYRKFGNNKNTKRSVISDKKIRVKLSEHLSDNLYEILNDLRPYKYPYCLYYNERSNKLEIISVWENPIGMWNLNNAGEDVADLSWYRFMFGFEFLTLEAALEYIPKNNKKFLSRDKAFEYLQKKDIKIQRERNRKYR